MLPDPTPRMPFPNVFGTSQSFLFAFAYAERNDGARFRAAILGKGRFGEGAFWGLCVLGALPRQWAPIGVPHACGQTGVGFDWEHPDLTPGKVLT